MLATIRVNRTLSVDFGVLEAGNDLGPFVLIARSDGGAVSLEPGEVPELAVALGKALAALNDLEPQENADK